MELNRDELKTILTLLEDINEVSGLHEEEWGLMIKLRTFLGEE